MAAGIVEVLKNKIKESGEEKEKYVEACEETRAKLNEEKKRNDEVEAEVFSLSRKIKLLEDGITRNEDRLELMSGKSQTHSDRLLSSEDKR